MLDVTHGPVRRRSTLDLVLHLVKQDFRLRYRRSVFGILWAIAQPVARLIVFAYLFTQVLPITDVDDYTAFLFTGLIAWTWFASGVSAGTASTLARRDLLFRTGIPRVVVPLVGVLADAVDYLIALPILLVYLVFNGGVPVSALLLPGVLLVQLVLIFGLTLLLSTANTYFRDVRMAVEVVLLLGFYATPVLYPPDQVPEQFQLLVDLNPVAQLLSMHRSVLLDGSWPSLYSVVFSTAAAALLFVVGLAVYRRHSPNFVDEL